MVSLRCQDRVRVQALLVLHRCRSSQSTRELGHCTFRGTAESTPHVMRSRIGCKR